MKIAIKEINIYEVENLHKKILKDIISVKSSYTLNFENVEKIDLNGIQLILSLKKYCDNKNISLKLTNIKSDNLKELFSIVSVEESLGLNFE